MKTVLFEPTVLMNRQRKWHMIKDLSAHFIATTLLSLTVYAMTGNIIYAGAAVFGGIFIDLDHLVDYFLRFGPRFSLKNFFYGTALSSGKVYIPLHAWEIMFLVLMLSAALRSFFLLVLFWGMTLHLLIDSMQRKNPRIYFLTYRAFYKFNINVLLPETLEHVASIKNR